MHHPSLFFFVSMFFKILIDIHSCTWFCFHFLQKVLKVKDHFSIFSKHKTWIWGIQKENIKFGSLCAMTKFGCIISFSFFFVSMFTQFPMMTWRILFLNPPNPRFVFWKYWKMVHNFEYFYKEMKIKSGTTININWIKKDDQNCSANR